MMVFFLDDTKRKKKVSLNENDNCFGASMSEYSKWST